MKKVAQPQIGFTLIEMMIVISAIGIIASIAIPRYTDYILRSRRADAHNTILRIQQDQARFRATNTTYGNESTTPALPYATISPERYYDIAVTSPTSTGYVITASPRDSQARDTTCSTITLTISGITETFGPTNVCWNKK
ncbi:type IV pilin protein [Macromonas nakdongensis]|uniref:type IV pilin protein n=1 Tax=Macromonas nakdongensis TaxID=1843082 RepID=UPI000C32430F|nr:type IV pilin protein [Macromonas nakdongensis]